MEVSNIIQKPYGINLANKTITAKELNRISWQNAGAIQWKRKIEIRKNSDNSTVFLLPEEFSTESFYDLPIDSLVNGDTYKILITVWDEALNTATSDPVLFQAYSRPNITITNLPSSISTNNINIEFSYLVDEPTGNEIRSWDLFLYDNEDSLIYSSGVQYTTNLEHLVTTLQNGKTYKVQIQAISAKNMIGLSPKSSFTVEYIEQPYDTSIQAYSIPNAGIEISWNVLQITGDGVNYSFLDNTKVDVTEGEVWFDGGYKIDGNFSIRMMFEQLPNEQFTMAENIKIFKYQELVDPTLSPTIEPEDLLVLDPGLSAITPVSLGIVASYSEPNPSVYDKNSFIWIQDPLMIGKPLRVMNIDRDGQAPVDTTTTLWLREEYDANAAIIAVFEEPNRTITLRRFNNNFVLSFSNDGSTVQFSATGERFCVVLKRINNIWSMTGGGFEL